MTNQLLNHCVRTKQKDKQVILEQAVLSLLQEKTFHKLTLAELGHLICFWIQITEMHKKARSLQLSKARENTTVN